MLKEYDVIISGAGPAGSLLGYLLAQKGIKALIIEKQAFPRKKVCAGGIQYRAIRLMPFDISEVIEREVSSLVFSNNGRGLFRKSYHKPVIFTVRRDLFDKYLLKRAIDNGCHAVTGERVKDFYLEKNGVRVVSTKTEYYSRLLVGADGCNGRVHRTLVKARDYYKIIGYESEICIGDQVVAAGMESEWYEDSILIDFFRSGKGYCWIFPKGKLLSLGAGGPYYKAPRLKSYFTDFLQKTVRGGSNSIDISAAIIPVRKEGTPFMSERVLTVGDAACLADGFTGEGIFNAIRSSFIAEKSISKALKSGCFRFTDYAEMLENEILKDIRISLRFVKKFYSVPLFYYNLLKYNQRFFDLCCKVLRGEVKYSGIAERLKFIRN